MAETLVGGLLFLGVMAVVALIFGGWVIGNIARAIGRSLGLIPTQPRYAPAPPRMANFQPPLLPDGAPGLIQCRVPGCRHFNPASARFCRHCGHAFPVAA